MKTALGVFLVACWPLFAPSRLSRKSVAILASLIAMLVISLPFCVQGSKNSEFNVMVYRLGSSETLRERTGVTWPAVTEYLSDNHAGLLGVGIGGLGSANAVGSHSFDFAFVDNLYLYLLGTGGLVGAALIIVLLRKMWRLVGGSRPISPHIHGPLLIFFVVYGFAQSVVETSFIAVYLGALLSAKLPKLGAGCQTKPLSRPIATPLPGSLSQQPGRHDMQSWI